MLWKSLPDLSKNIKLKILSLKLSAIFYLGAAMQKVISYVKLSVLWNLLYFTKLINKLNWECHTRNPSWVGQIRMLHQTPSSHTLDTLQTICRHALDTPKVIQRLPKGWIWIFKFGRRVGGGWHSDYSTDIAGGDRHDRWAHT